MNAVDNDMIKNITLTPTEEMIDEGAKRLVSWDDGCIWPDSWDKLQIIAARNDAERVWRSMWIAAPNESLRYSGQGLPGEPVDAPSLEGRMKQEASL